VEVKKRDFYVKNMISKILLGFRQGWASRVEVKKGDIFMRVWQLLWFLQRKMRNFEEMTKTYKKGYRKFPQPVLKHSPP